MSKYINKTTGDIIDFDTYLELSKVGRDKYKRITSSPNPPQRTVVREIHHQDRGMTLGEGIATAVTVPFVIARSILPW
jgi:hypothetical protein